ncbi:hemicentin-1-like [Actinia tenebrosa]|uniref:Hemicentin-1-like n=1 Tax=Actinia tenebrosa TaxID=6105 RepID=A0A6P8HJT7_ACTTE|nr:hemicentin-1-like [Actinia tenebrosa]
MQEQDVTHKLSQYLLNIYQKVYIGRIFHFLLFADKPEIDAVQSNDTVSSYNDGTVRIYCLAHGVPSPLFTWYDTPNRSIATGSHNVTGGSVLELETIDAGSYGLYKCKAENLLGYDEHIINVTQTALPTSTIPSESKRHVKSSISIVNKEKTRSPVGRNIPLKVNEDIILLAAGGAVVFVLITTIIILAVMIYIKYSNNKSI